MSRIVGGSRLKGACPMPHYKCLTCRTRLRVSQPTVSVRDLCPQCGSLLEPVGDLAEVIGFRAIAPVSGSVLASETSAQERIARRIGDFVTHRDRRHARELSGIGAACSLDGRAADA